MIALFVSLFLGSVSALTVVAHRGVHHTYGKHLPNGCREFLNQRHRYIENTVPSIRAAFDYGANMVEIDLMVSHDGEVFLFHDEDLRCHLGLDRSALETPWSEIADRDPGFGVSFDEGRTFPLRNTGARIPRLADVLRTFPGRGFLLNPKLYAPKLVAGLIAQLQRLSPQQRKQFWFWGNEQTFREVHARFPEIDVFLAIPWQHQRCMDEYFSIGWSGAFPRSCENRQISLGDDRWWMLWDFPFPFLQRAQEHGLEVSLWLGNRIRHPRVYEGWPIKAIVISNIDQQEGL